MMVAGTAFDLNSLLSTEKVSLLNREQTPRTRAGNNNLEYKLHEPVQGIIIWSINSTNPCGE